MRSMGKLRSQWFKLDAAYFLFPVPASFTRSSSVQGWILIVNIPGSAFPTTTAHSNIFNQSIPSKQVLPCTIFYPNRVSRPKSTSQHATAYWWHESHSGIQLPECRRPKPQLHVVCSLIISLHTSWLPISHNYHTFSYVWYLYPMGTTSVMSLGISNLSIRSSSCKTSLNVIFRHFPVRFLTAQ